MLLLQGLFFGVAVPIVCVLVCTSLLMVTSSPALLLTSCISMCCAVCTTHMLLHRWQDSPERYQVLVILSLPAVYAILTGLAQLLPEQRLYLGVCSEIYEGLGLVTFLLLLRTLSGSGRGDVAAVFAALPYDCMAATLPIYKIGFLLAATVDSSNHLGIGSRLARADLFCSFALGSLALGGIGSLLAGLSRDLGRKALPLKHKFWAVKGVVTVMFNQSLLLWLLARPLDKLLDLLEMRAREEFEATLVALEMLLLALWHTVAFPLLGERGGGAGALAARSPAIARKSIGAPTASAAPSASVDDLVGVGGNGAGAEAWLWPWTVAQMTILASCLLVRSVDLLYHVWFVLGCALSILIAFGCRWLRPVRAMVVVGAVSHLFAVYLLALGRQSTDFGRCLLDIAPLSANGLALSEANCTEQLHRGNCGALRLQGFCCVSCNTTSCPHCEEGVDSLGSGREHQVRVGACMALTTAMLMLLARVGHCVLGSGSFAGEEVSLDGGPGSCELRSTAAVGRDGADGGAGPTEYHEFDSDIEMIPG